MMITRQLVMGMLSDCWQDECDITGSENVKNIVDDILAGAVSAENFAVPTVGDHFDTSFSLEILLSAAQLIVGILQILMSNQNSKKDSALDGEAIKAAVEAYIRIAESKAWETLDENQKKVFVLRLMNICGAKE